jgi:D-aminopeptidase
MRVYISVDMEGVAGVVHEDQTDPIDPRHAGEYNRFRRLMTGEANAAIERARRQARGARMRRSCWPRRFGSRWTSS